jgi:predicted flap endonuclease-1-like 5' DNA nuclease
MSKAVVFAIAFLLLFVVTLIIPALPPGEMISNLVGISGTASILGFSVMTIINGILNGLIWGAIIFIIYVLVSPPPKKKDFPSMMAPNYPPAPRPIPTEATTSLTMSAKPRARRKTKVKKRKTYTALDQDIETIEGIGPTYGNKLRNSGVKVVEDLLTAGSTRRKRRILAHKVGVSSATLLKWVYRADFFRIRGIGTQYSSLLESAGVNTVTDLSRRNPKNLYVKLREVNRKKNLVRRMPPYRTIRGWINSAKNLKRIVED